MSQPCGSTSEPRAAPGFDVSCNSVILRACLSLGPRSASERQWWPFAHEGVQRILVHLLHDRALVVLRCCRTNTNMDSQIGRARDPASSQGTARAGHKQQKVHAAAPKLASRPHTGRQARYALPRASVRTALGVPVRALLRMHIVAFSPIFASPVQSARTRTLERRRGRAAMGRKDSNKSSRTSRKRDNDSWGDGWEVTHTRTSNTPGKGAVQLIRDPCVRQELCQPSALPPATVSLHAGLPPIIPPGTELEISADALPTEAEVRPQRVERWQPSPARTPSSSSNPTQVHVLREDGLSATMISTDNFLSAAEYAARRARQLRPHPPAPPPPHPALHCEVAGRRACSR